MVRRDIGESNSFAGHRSCFAWAFSDTEHRRISRQKRSLERVFQIKWNAGLILRYKMIKCYIL